MTRDNDTNRGVDQDGGDHWPDVEDRQLVDEAGQRYVYGRQDNHPGAEDRRGRRRRQGKAVDRDFRRCRRPPARWLTHEAQRYARTVPGTLPLSTGNASAVRAKPLSRRARPWPPGLQPRWNIVAARTATMFHRGRYRCGRRGGSGLRGERTGRMRHAGKPWRVPAGRPAGAPTGGQGPGRVERSTPRSRASGARRAGGWTGTRVRAKPASGALPAVSPATRT